MVATCLNNNIDHPKKNSEFVIVTAEKIEFLDEELTNKLFDDLDEA